jgi:hypothetical protein
MNADIFIGIIIGIVVSIIVFYTYSSKQLYGGELFIDRGYVRPDIYLELDQRYERPVDVAKQRYILLKVRVIRSNHDDRPKTYDQASAK